MEHHSISVCPNEVHRSTELTHLRRSEQLQEWLPMAATPKSSGVSRRARIRVLKSPMNRMDQRISTAHQ